jgi:hypothetical protein
MKPGDRLVGLTAPYDCLEFWTAKPAAGRGRVKKKESKDQNAPKP